MFSNGKSLLLEYLLALWLGLMVSGLHAQEEPAPANIPGTDASDDFHDSSKSRASISSYHTRYCDCNGSFTNRFVELPTTYGRPQSVQITSIEVRGDLASSNEYIDFKVSGASNWIRYQGGADSANYRRYSYFSAQPTISYNYSSSSYGFYFDYFVSSAVNTSPSGISPAGVFYNIKVNYTVSFADPGPITPPSFNSITPGNGRLTLNITPPSSGPTPVLYHGYCGRSAGQQGASLDAPISISAFGFTSSYLAPVADSERYVVGNVTGSVNLSHQWRGELELKLISPSGRSATLWTGDELDSNTNLSFSFSKSDFNGTGASGSWRLRIEDRVEGDGGTLNNWNLAFNTREEQLGTSSSQTSITVSSLTNGETYSCYATSLDSQGIESGASRSRSALVGNTPGKPTITVDPEDKTALVTVKSVATGGLDITRYEGVCQSSRGVRTVTSTSKTIEVAPLTNGLGYLCKARARNQQGWGPFSDEEKVRPDEQPYNGLPVWLLYVASNQLNAGGGGSGGTSTPGAPGQPTARAGNGYVELGWAPPSRDGGAAITGYRIQQGFAANNESAYATVVSNTGSASTIYTVRGLNNGTAYNFRVAAINAAGVGAYSDNTQATPTNAEFLGCSSSLVTCASDSQDLGERGNSINQGFREFAIPAGQILAIPFTTSESISAFNSGYVDRYSFQTFPAGYTFHTWWSDDAGDMPRAGAGCTAASANYQGRVYWRDSAGASDCGLGTGEHRRWFNVAICDSPFDCLPMNGHNYYQGSYYLSLDSRGT